MSQFFINRPIVAMVISILMIVIGATTLKFLPVAQFPSIVPPEVQVIATYVGADAQTIEQAVATPIEQQLSGVDNMNYMYSLNASAAGQTRLTVNFDEKTDPNTDLILTQMRQTLASPQLPADVTNFGVTVQKSVSAPLMMLALHSPHGTRDARFLANYSYINLNDQFLRLPGIAMVQVWGAGQYAMRIWLKPDQLAKLGITVTDIAQAIRAQNTVNPSGKVGGEPVPRGQEFTYSVLAQGRLASPEDFGDIVIREAPNGGVVRIRDVARIDLGAQDYSAIGRFNGNPSAIIALFQLPGSNAVDTATSVLKLMAEAKKRFPPDIDYAVALDTTAAVREGMREIVETLFIAIALVAFVVYIFLQDWRATLIPLLAVPVSLVGTFTFFPLFGFSINTLSLFGLVLAIGLVVDDAIIVVEAVARHIEEGLPPKQAAVQAMREITGPVIGIALVLSAVFVPTAFIPGITGRLYQQFAVTTAIAVVISAFNALSLSPALSALILRPRAAGGSRSHGFFNWFNRRFDAGTHTYVRLCGGLIRKSVVTVAILVVCTGGAALIGNRLPSSFLPDEDQGYVYINFQLPKAASLQRTEEVVSRIEKIVAATPGVNSYTGVAGYSMLSGVRNTFAGFVTVSFKKWRDRSRKEEQYHEIEQHLNRELSKFPDAMAFSFAPPAIPGVGTAGGFTFVLEDRAGRDIDFLSRNLDKFMAAARQRPEITGLNTTFLGSVPGLFVNVNRDKTLKQGVPLGDVYRTIQTFMGGLFINYFNRFGRQWQVYLQADGDYRNTAENIGRFYVRNAANEMVPLASLTSIEPRLGPEFTMRFNLYRSAQINGRAAPGYSSSQAMKALEDVFASTMPKEMGYDYMGMSFQEKKAQQGVPASVIFGFSLLFVFLILAALYESWSLPFSVLLSTPVAIFGAFFVLWLRRVFLLAVSPSYMVSIENDVFSQIGMVMLIGLSAKNAILIVEFAKTAYEGGSSLVDAALEGARLRLRPILMTSFAFIFGCVPLWIASGAGSVSRQIMGTTVIGGMLAASALGIFVIPAIFYLVERLSGAGSESNAK
ncbi:MAG: multidrug efflux RND transporter permease subunit [Bryobacterales bacterium]|nr:multidrug efflux RND transporter permease subunit [Bryobacterales bacterium]